MECKSPLGLETGVYQHFGKSSVLLPAYDFNVLCFFYYYFIVLDELVAKHVSIVILLQSNTLI